MGGLEIDPLGLVMRWLHILAAITAVGGTIFSRFALAPAAAELPDSTRAQLLEAIRRRWSKWIAAAILFLLVSGLTNFLRFIPEAREWRLPWYGPYNMLFGIKFMLALGIFFIASSLAGRSGATAKIRDNAKFWMSVNLALALAVVMISGVLRAQHTGPNVPRDKPLATSPAANPTASPAAAPAVEASPSR